MARGPGTNTCGECGGKGHNRRWHTRHENKVYDLAINCEFCGGRGHRKELHNDSIESNELDQISLLIPVSIFSCSVALVKADRYHILIAEGNVQLPILEAWSEELGSLNCGLKGFNMTKFPIVNSVHNIM
ncbi:hypothetical protein C2G38_2036331 [Gigaspora rosea]|uniref:Uncharacterized protein n=1 Tax=Gigaspora rosea TaxID=44941 RepID=A0A397V996_9GLOM|nr:hypothetical protein C2G38_2036331 [Gigaspora rosea]